MEIAQQYVNAVLGTDLSNMIFSSILGFYLQWLLNTCIWKSSKRRTNFKSHLFVVFSFLGIFLEWLLNAFFWKSTKEEPSLKGDEKIHQNCKIVLSYWSPFKSCKLADDKKDDL